MPSVNLVASPSAVPNPKIVQKTAKLDGLLLTSEGKEQIADFLMRNPVIKLMNDPEDPFDSRFGMTGRDNFCSIRTEEVLQKTKHRGGILLRKLISKLPEGDSYIKNISYIYSHYSYDNRKSELYKSFEKLIADIDYDIKHYVAKQKEKLQRVGVLKCVIRGLQKKTAAIKSEGGFVELLRKAGKGAGKWLEKAGKWLFRLK